MNVSQTQRLSLRLLALEDLESVHGLIYADPEVAVPLVGHVLSLEEVRSPRGLLSRIARASDEAGLFGIVRLPDRALIGIGGLLELRRTEDRDRFAPPEPSDAAGAMPGRRDAEFTIALGRAHWGRRYGAEAGAAIIDLGFRSLLCNRVLATFGADNERARQLLVGLGFRIVPNGQPRAASGTVEAGHAGLIGILDGPPAPG